MSLLGGRKYRRRKKEEIRIEGYLIDHANDVVPGLDRTDETFHIYGVDSPETDVQHNFGSLTIGVLDKEVNNRMMDLITGQKPDPNALRQYTVASLTGVDVWANVKDRQNTKYIKAWLIANWTPGMPVGTGAPNDKAAYSAQGNGDLPRQFQNCWIKSAKVTSGATPVLPNSDVPLQVPGETGIYAVRVKALDETGGAFEQEPVAVGADMVDSTGSVDFAAIEAQVESLAQVTGAFILYLQSGTGIAPTIDFDGLYD